MNKNVNIEQQEKLEAWIKERIEIAKENGDDMFLSIPEKWYNPIWYCCNNGHVNDSYLKSEMFGGCVCLDCYQPSHIYPNDVSLEEFHKALR